MLPRVTTVLNVISKGEGLLRWVANNGWKESQRIKFESADRGTTVHAIAASILRGETISVGESLEGYVAGIEKAVVRFGLMDGKALIEQRLVNLTDGYCGTCDFVTDTWVGDWKTSGALHFENDLQISAYLNALRDMQERGDRVAKKVKLPKKGVLIRLDGRGGFEYKISSEQDLSLDYGGFKNALGLFNLMKTKGMMNG